MAYQWKLVPGRGEDILDPSWQQIEDALAEMNGDIYEVTLELVDEGTLFIEGGDQGRYLVVYFPATHPDVPSCVLTDLSLSGSLVPLTVQTPTEYEAKYAVLFPLVVKVVSDFFHAGSLPRDVRWELDNTHLPENG